MGAISLVFALNITVYAPQSICKILWVQRMILEVNLNILEIHKHQQTLKCRESQSEINCKIKMSSLNEIRVIACL